MTSLASQKLFVATSDYPIDKIITIKSGSFSMPASTSDYIHIIPHGLDFMPLCNGNWALTPDFDIIYELSVGTFPSTAPGYLFDTVANVYADATNIYIGAYNLTATDRTLYYRVYGFEPAGSNGVVAPIAYEADDFVLNSDYNYPKLYGHGSGALPSTSATGAIITADHNLGYVPQAMGWTSGNTWNGTETVTAAHPVGSSNLYSGNIQMRITDMQVQFVVPPYTFNPRTAYFRIYLDS